MKDKINVLGIYIDRITKQELYESIEKSLNSDCKTKIFTPNPEIIVKAQKDEKIKNILNSATLSIPDGTGIIWAAKKLGTPLPQRLDGIDTAEFVLSLAVKKGLSVFLLGAEEGIAKSAKYILEEKYQGLNICGTHHGFFDINGQQNGDIIHRINNSGADILFVCMGFPRQEIWINENIEKLNSVRLGMGLGGSLDVWSGKVRRAPKVFRKLYLEWLWRIILEPKRIRFLPVIPLFVLKVLRERSQKYKN